jgi:photosystem II stability/assembly factor-like uncharacterized protein
MAKGNILVGTVGQGVMVSSDNGDTWVRVQVSRGMHSEAVIRALRADPRHPETVYAGSDQGLYRSDDAGGHWQLLDTPMRGSAIWCLAIDPVDPNIMFVGVGSPSTPGVYRSTDAGTSWEHRPMEIIDECPNVGIPRPTGIAIDPLDHDSVWVGIEVDGVRHSSDGGNSWTKINGQIPNLDVHNVLVTSGPPKAVFTVVNDDIYRSTDDGETWQPAHARESFPWHYTRDIVVKPNDPQTLFITLGDATPGRTGTLMRSRDAGATWGTLNLPSQPNSAMWTVSIANAEPETMFAASRYGYLYRSDDGGDSWRKLWREFSEVAAVLWVPA